MPDASNRIAWDRHVDPQHLRELAKHVWGQDAEHSMRDFEPSDGLLTLYNNTIVDNAQALVGKRVLDMGCNNGLYSYLAMRHGAAHVVGVEPRGMYVKGLNAFSDAHGLRMEFHRGYDTDLPRLVREHQIDTVMLIAMDNHIDWEGAMVEIRKSKVQWLIMRLTPVPDSWMGYNSELIKFADHGGGMPVGFTLHYSGHNSSTLSGINPVHRDLADPDTGFQHTDPSGNFDNESSTTFINRRSENYTQQFIQQCGYTVESHKTQDSPLVESPSLPSSLEGFYHWYLLRNPKN